MIIVIEIPSPPNGYSIPERKPLYLPFGDALILIGNSWAKATDICGPDSGGEFHIWCNKKGE